MKSVNKEVKSIKLSSSQISKLFVSFSVFFSCYEKCHTVSQSSESKVFYLGNQVTRLYQLDYNPGAPWLKIK